MEVRQILLGNEDGDLDDADDVDLPDLMDDPDFPTENPQTRHCPSVLAAFYCEGRN